MPRAATGFPRVYRGRVRGRDSARTPRRADARGGAGVVRVGELEAAGVRND